MKFSIFLLGTLLLSASLQTQDYKKIFPDPSDQTTFYFEVRPDGPARGLLILLPGSRGDSEWPLKTTKIPYLAAEKGIVTIMINYEIWLCWMRDDILELLNVSVNDVISRHHIPVDKCAIGGFSGGGAIALNYAELSFQEPVKTAIQPAAVFALDSPVDLVELYRVNKLEVDGFICNGEILKASEETRVIYQKMKSHLGSPEDSIKNYIQHSAFTFTERYNDGGTAIYLKDLPVRIYSGISPSYMQDKSECGFYLDTSPFLVSFLNHRGNADATFKSQYDEDYNPDGGEKFRGRHAWLGFDSKECVNWILESLEIH